MIRRPSTHSAVATVIIAVVVAPIAVLIGALFRSPEPAELWLLVAGPSAAAFLRGMVVQLFLAATGTVAMTATVVAAGYALSLLSGRCARVLTMVFVVPLVINGGIIPTYIVVRSLALIDHPAVLLLAERIDVVMVLAIAAVFASQRVRSLREAASVDGATPVSAMVRVVIPAVAHPVLAVAALSALRFWNSWFPAFLFVHSPELRPAQNVLRSLAATAESTRGGELVRGLSAAGEAGIAFYALVLLVPGLAIVAAVRKAGEAALNINQ